MLAIPPGTLLLTCGVQKLPLRGLVKRRGNAGPRLYAKLDDRLRIWNGMEWSSSRPSSRRNRSTSRRGGGSSSIQ